MKIGGTIMKIFKKIAIIGLIAAGFSSCAHHNRHWQGNTGIRPVGDGMYVVSNRSSWGWTHAAYENALSQGEKFCSKRGMAFDLISSDAVSSRPYRYNNYYYGDAYDLDTRSGVNQEVVFSCDPGSYDRGLYTSSSYYYY